MKVKILSWNVNSIRARLEHIENVSNEYLPDIICLQETKVTNQDFPIKKIKELGFNYIYLNGIKSYNGVCILSKIKASNIKIIDWCGEKDGRHIQAEINGITVHSFYVPAGGDLPDSKQNPKFKHKIQFLDELIKWSNKLKFKNSILCGDLNIAPLIDDVWSHEKLKNVVSHTKIEREKLIEVQKSGNWFDAKDLIEAEENLFTWWSYRSPDFKRNNRGRRLDHIWTSNDLIKKIKKIEILKVTREWSRPSDHVPIWIELDV